MATENIKSFKTFYMVGVISISLGTLFILRKKEEKETCELTYVASFVNVLNGNSGKSWLNLGYWTEDNKKNYGHAAEMLAVKVMEPRKKGGEDDEPIIIDAGCGLGESLNLWTDVYNADDKSFGINLSQAEVDIAKLRKVDMVSRMFVGNACDIPAKNESADVIIAVDAAYHFITRSMFIQEASRVLKNDGFFGTADVITSNQSDNSNFIKRFILQWKRWLVGILVGIPYENMYDAKHYSYILSQNNFTNIDIRDVTEFVPVGFAKWGWEESGSWPVAAVASFVCFTFKFAELNFVLVSANKSKGNGYAAAK